MRSIWKMSFLLLPLCLAACVPSYNYTPAPGQKSATISGMDKGMWGTTFGDHYQLFSVDPMTCKNKKLLNRNRVANVIPADRIFTVGVGYLYMGGAYRERCGPILMSFRPKPGHHYWVGLDWVEGPGKYGAYCMGQLYDSKSTVLNKDSLLTVTPSLAREYTRKTGIFESYTCTDKLSTQKPS